MRLSIFETLKPDEKAPIIAFMYNSDEDILIEFMMLVDARQGFASVRTLPIFPFKINMQSIAQHANLNGSAERHEIGRNGSFWMPEKTGLLNQVFNKSSKDSSSARNA